MKKALLISLTLLGPSTTYAAGRPDCDSQSDDLHVIELGHRYSANKGDSRMPRVYFLLPRKLKGEHLKVVEQNVEALRELGIEQVWLSNLNEQTTKDFFGSYNDHGYWPKTHDARQIDKSIGGPKAHQQLLQRLQSNEMNIMVDAVINHMGYGQEFVIEYRTETGKVIRKTVKETDDFFQPREKGDAPDHVMFRPEHETTQGGVIEAINRAAEYNLAGLPTLNPHSKLVQDYMFHSYRERIDQGIDTIRFDAGKHKPVWFTELLVKRLNDYSMKRYGRKVRIVGEFLYHKHFVLDSILDYMYEKVPGSEFYLFDFPLANELRATVSQDYPFQNLEGYLRHRERQGLRQHNRLLPILEDHDFLSPIRSRSNAYGDPFAREMAYVLSEFISHNPTVLYHGAENAPSSLDTRPLIKSINRKGSLGQTLKKVSDAMEVTRTWPARSLTDVHVAEGNVFIASKKTDKGRVFLFINRGKEGVQRSVSMDGATRNSQIQNVHANGKTFSWSENGQFNFKSDGPSIDVFTVEY